MNDSRGNPSLTVTLVVPACIVVISKYLVSGVMLGAFGVQPLMTASEFGSGFMMILAPLIAREINEKLSNA
jgi:hypothetical protein